MRILLAENLEYHLGARDLIEGVSFELQHGDRLALVGANGSGKTTLLKLLTGDLEASRGKIVWTEGVHLELLDQDPKYDANETVETVLKSGFRRIQEMEEQLSVLEQNLGDIETYEHWEILHERYEVLGGYQQRTRYESVLNGLKFGDRENEKVAVLSGGEVKRLALGALLLSGSDALFLDEPTNHLDIEMVGWLEGFLKNYGGATITVSHDRKFMDAVTERVAWLSEGTLKLYKGNYSAFRKQRVIMEEQAVRDYETWTKEKDRLADILEQARRWAAGSAKHTSRMHNMEAKVEQHIATEPPKPAKAERSVRAQFPVDEKALGPDRMIEAWNLRKSMDERTLFDIKNVLVKKGERIAIIGPNGAGKSTMLKSLLGEIVTDDPKVEIKIGYNVRIGYYDQKLSGFDPEPTLFETLYKQLGEKGARTALGGWMFPYDAQFKQVKSLSGGEKARLALLHLSLQKANLLVLDEPTNHLDLQTVEALEEALLDYPGTVLLVSHDLAFLDRLATRTWHIHNGQFIDYETGPSEYLERHNQKIVPDAPKVDKSPDKIQTNMKASPESKTKGKSKWHLGKEKERLELLITQLEEKLSKVLEDADEPDLHHSEYAKIALDQVNIEAELNQAIEEWTEVGKALQEMD